MSEVKVFIEGKTKKYDAGTRIKDIAGEYSHLYRYDIIAAIRNGKVTELNKRIEKDCKLSFVTTDTVIGNSIYIRGLSMLMLKAMYNVVGHDNVDKVAIEATIGNAYYCEFEGKVKLDDGLLAKVSEKMHEYVKRDMTFKKMSMSTDDAVKMFA
ncbi:MAG: nucleoside kinase, partial [Lachnospiraceae bacterium]|nr:nucleoside kinase [Lachnospiraceae bacterium]